MLDHLLYPARPMEMRVQDVDVMLDGARSSFVIQPKLDGKRVLAVFTDVGVVTLNRHLQPTAVPADVAADLALMDGLGEETVLDCELVGDTLFVFDMPLLRGRHRGWLMSRLRVLSVAVRATKHVRLVPEINALTASEALDSALKDGHEGIVVKKGSSLYPWHTTDKQSTYSWVKVKRAS